MQASMFHIEDTDLDGLSDIWAVFALVFLSLFIGILSLLVAQSTPDMSAELAADNANLIAALDSAASQARDARAELAVNKTELEAQAVEHQAELTKVRSDHDTALGQIEQEGRRADAAESAASAMEQSLKQARQAASSATKRADDAEQRLATRALETEFVVDVSGSMSEEHKRLGEDQKILIEALAPVAPLSVGVIGYRKDRRTFPLTRIHPEAVDGGRSLAALNGFIDRLKASGGNVDLIAAVRDAMRSLNASPNGSAKRSIVIVSDVSVYETQGETAATQFIEELGHWVRSDPRNAVLVVFTGDKPKDQVFYRRLADAGGPRVTVTENLSRMLPELLRAMTTR